VIVADLLTTRVPDAENVPTPVIAAVRERMP
jgi:hypothetical protein